MINTVHVTTSVSRRAGGLFECVRLLSKSLLQTGRVELSVLGVEDDCSEADSESWAPVDLRVFPSRNLKRFGYSPEMGRHLMEIRPDIVHLHGLWQYTALATRRRNRDSGTPYIVSVHGMLEPWSLSQSRWKKEIISFLFHRSFLMKADCIMATSAMEVESIRAAGYRNPIANIPNGVEFPESLPTRRPSAIRKALFLSRIHPKKGLVNLIKAWGVIRPADWKLVIIGPDEVGHLAVLKDLVAEERLGECISFQGEAWGDLRSTEYLNADLFVLPTSSENFGLVIPEALSHGVPVITTKGAPWEDLERFECGWWIDLGIEPLVAALREAFSLPQEVLAEMGARGREMVRLKYSWGPIGETVADVYGWVKNGGKIPDCVIMP